MFTEGGDLIWQHTQARTAASGCKEASLAAPSGSRLHNSQPAYTAAIYSITAYDVGHAFHPFYPLVGVNPNPQTHLFNSLWVRHNHNCWVCRHLKFKKRAVLLAPHQHQGFKLNAAGQLAHHGKHVAQA